MWTVNFLMFKLVLEKAEELDIKSPTFAGSWKKEESSRKTSISALLTMPKSLIVWILQKMGIPDHHSCLQRNLYAGQEATVITGHGTTDRFQIGKGVITRLYIVILFAEYIMWNARLDEPQARIKIARRNINNLRYADDTTLIAESEEELKNLLMRWKRRVKKLA